MRALILLVLLLQVLPSAAQQTYRTTNGTIRFNASTPLEDIEAVNPSVNGIYRPEDRQLAVVLLLKEFNFPNKLMQEHFNENYLHTEKYPKATFTATVTAPDPATNAVKFHGHLTLHGVKREVVYEGYLSETSSGYDIRSEFIIRPEDHNIKIPRLLFKKIAKEVDVQVKFELEE